MDISGHARFFEMRILAKTFVSLIAGGFGITFN